MEEIKSYYGMNLEQNLPFSWAPFKTGRKQGMVDGWKSKRVQSFKIERTNLKLENGAKKKFGHKPVLAILLYWTASHI